MNISSMSWIEDFSDEDFPSVCFVCGKKDGIKRLANLPWICSSCDIVTKYMTICDVYQLPIEQKEKASQYISMVEKLYNKILH